MAVVGTDRKSLMLDNQEYSKISKLAKAAGVARPLVIQAMLQIVDEQRLTAALADLRAREAVASVEERKKRQALAKMAEGMDMTQIAALMEQINKQLG